MSAERGMALISVLWVVLILSLVTFSLAAAVRGEVAAAQQSFDGDRAMYMAKGAADVVFASYSKQQAIPKDSQIQQGENEYIVPFDGGEAHVRFESDSGRIDINKASDVELAWLFDSLGIDQDTRNHLVDSILDWRDADDIPHIYGAEVGDYQENVPGQPASRPRNADFQTVEELLQVKNMTPGIFYGSFAPDPVTGGFHRTPGLRDLVTVRSGSDKINPNLASIDVLAALPFLTRDIAEEMVAVRTGSPFKNIEDLLSRVSGISNRETLGYFSFEAPSPSALVSRATISSSGVSKSVRLLFKRVEKIHVITFTPYVFTRTVESVPDRWSID